MTETESLEILDLAKRLTLFLKANKCLLSVMPYANTLLKEAETTVSKHVELEDNMAMDSCVQSISEPENKRILELAESYSLPTFDGSDPLNRDKTKEEARESQQLELGRKDRRRALRLLYGNDPNELMTYVGLHSDCYDRIKSIMIDVFEAGQNYANGSYECTDSRTIGYIEDADNPNKNEEAYVKHVMQTRIEGNIFTCPMIVNFGEEFGFVGSWSVLDVLDGALADMEHNKKHIDCDCLGHEHRYYSLLALRELIKMVKV